MSEDSTTNTNTMQSSSPATAVAAAIASGGPVSGGRGSGRRSSKTTANTAAGTSSSASTGAAAASKSAAARAATKRAARITTSTVATNRGRRTGVQVVPLGSTKITISPTSGMEDIDSFWESGNDPAASANPAHLDGTDERLSKASKEELKERARAERQAKRDAARQSKAAQARERADNKSREIEGIKPNFDLVPTPAGGTSTNSSGAAGAGGNGAVQAENSDPQSGKIGGTWAARMTSALTKSAGGGTKLSFSPSDMSRVSTAPPTPFVPEGKVEEEEDMFPGADEYDEYDAQEEQDDMQEEQGEEKKEEEEEMVATPEQTRDADITGSASATTTPLEGILRQKSSRGSSSTPGSIKKIGSATHLDVDGEDDLFPAGDDDDDDDMNGMGDDMVGTPPPPAEDSMEDLVHNTSMEEEQLLGQDDMDDEDDKDEGVGFQLADDDHDQDQDQDDEEEAATANQTAGSPSLQTTADEDKQDEEEEEDVANAKKKSKSKKAKSKKSKKEIADITPEDGKKKKKKRRKKVTYADRVNNFSTPTGKSHGYPAGNRDYQLVPVSDYKEGDEEEDTGVRRSKRARFAPLAYWKNERLAYEANQEEGTLGEAMGDMPVVSGVLQALPTPYKERKAMPTKKRGKKGGGGRKRGGKGGEDDDGSYDDSTYATRDVKPFDTKRLRKKFDYIDDEKAVAWNESNEETEERKLVSYSEGRVMADLPLSKRGKKESKVVARASQAFNEPGVGTFPGWISGQLDLPPTGIKDAESVGLCSQVFNVASCQPKALEFALADPEESEAQFLPETAQRFLLSPGDMFCVPAGNMYRIENHSKTHDCKLFWTIIRPAPGEA